MKNFAKILTSLAIIGGTIGLIPDNAHADTITTVNPDTIPNRSYVIGSHLFTRELNDDYPGYVSTATLMLAAQSIEGDSIDQMVVYYKNAHGVWVDGLDSSREVTLPENGFEIRYKNLETVAE